MKAQYHFSEEEKLAMRLVLRKYKAAPPHHQEILSSLDVAGDILLWPDEALYLAGIIRPYYSSLADQLRQHPEVSSPNRVVIEMDDSGPVCVRAARPTEALIIIRHVKPRFGSGQIVYGDGGLPIEPLAVVDGPREVRFEVRDDE